MTQASQASPAAPLLSQLEINLKQLLHEHRSLLRALDDHEAALRSCALDRVEKAARDQDAARQRVAQVDGRRRVIVHQLARQHRTSTVPTVASLIQMYPDRKVTLSALRADLHEVGAQIQKKSSLVARVAQSVLGHVNATLRLVAHATAGPSPYTRSGQAPMPRRMGVLNAVA